MRYRLMKELDPDVAYQISFWWRIRHVEQPEIAFVVSCWAENIGDRDVMRELLARKMLIGIQTCNLDIEFCRWVNIIGDGKFLYLRLKDQIEKRFL